MKKKFLSVLLIAIVAGGGFYWWKSSHSDAAQQQAAAPPPAEVTFVTIAAKSVDITADLPGRTSAYRISEIRPQVNGIIMKRLFEEGSDVTEGQQLYQIDPATYQAAVASTQADLMKAQANAKSVLAKQGRYAELVKIGGVSQQEYDDIQASVSQANADIAIAKAALDNAKINLDYTKVFSPISGRIGKSMVTEGALVTANQTQPLATVQQLDPIYVDVTQASTDLLKLRRALAGKENSAAKMPVTLFVEGDTEPFAQKGELQFSDVSVDETTGSVQLRVLFPNSDHQLMPGMFVKARVGQSEQDQAITVPQKVTTRNPDGSASVTLIGEGDKVEIRPIKISDSVGNDWLVTDGLKAGDRLIVEGYQKVKAGDVVKPVEAQAPGQEPPVTPPEQKPAEPSDSSKPKE